MIIQLQPHLATREPNLVHTTGHKHASKLDDLLRRQQGLCCLQLHAFLRHAVRAPQIASQFTPFAALLGIVVTLAGLSHTSEITIMRAAGMSIHRVLFPLGFVCALVAATHFLFHETVTVKAGEALDYWEANDYALDLPADTGTRTNIWIEFDGEIISAESFHFPM